MTQQQSTAVAVREPQQAITSLRPIEVNLDNWPTSRFNRVIPTQTISMPNDLVVPVFQVVQLDPADATGKSPDHYKSNDVPPGHRALTARGINKLVTAAGVSFFDERRLDDGTDPDVMGVTVMASLMLPTGVRITAPGSQLINIRSWFGPTTSAAELAKFRKQFYANVSTRARNRAARGLLSLRASYPEAEINRPFAVVSYAPNLAHPAVQQRYIENMLPAINAGFGPDQTRQIAAGQVIEVAEAPEDDGPTDGHYSESSASVAGSPAGSDGSAAATEEPDWAKPAAGDPFAAAPAAGPSRLVQVLRDKATKSGMAGAITDAQKPQVMAALGGDVPLLRAGLQAVWGVESDEGGRLLVTAAQAQAIIGCAVDDTFLLQWQEAFGQVKAA
jgi:hypothetical protein